MHEFTNDIMMYDLEGAAGGCALLGAELREVGGRNDAPTFGFVCRLDPKAWLAGNWPVSSCFHRNLDRLSLRSSASYMIAVRT